MEPARILLTPQRRHASSASGSSATGGFKTLAMIQSSSLRVVAGQF
jgi:hypothetical protein